MGTLLRLVRPSPALVIASIALAISLGGVGYAAITLPRNSVGARQLRNNAVSSAKVRNRSLRGIDFARGTLLRGARGATGAAGARGGSGPQGPAGPAGPRGVGIGSSCSGEAGIRAVSTSGAVTCQTPANNSADGYLTAADHAAFAAPHSFSWENALLANATVNVHAGTYRFAEATVSIPAGSHIAKLAADWQADWTGGTASAPVTLACFAELIPPGIGLQTLATRSSTNDGGSSEIALNGLFDVGPGTYTFQIDCNTDTGTATVHNADAVLIGTE